VARKEVRGSPGLVVFAKNKKRVSAFYEEVLGLTRAVAEPSHDVLRGDGIEVVVHAIPEKYAADITISRPPAVRGDSAFKPAFFVQDLDVARRTASKRGGFVKPTEAAWAIRGAVVLDGWDPEGNVIQLKQVAAEKATATKMPQTSGRATRKPRVFAMSFASVYPLYVQKAKRKGRTSAEVDEVIAWLTGYRGKALQRAIDARVDLETFFAEAPRMNPNAGLITGVVCGVRVEDVADPLMQKVRYLDKLIDELAAGKKMDSILRE